jgi:inward rectifier potassium channel
MLMALVAVVRANPKVCAAGRLTQARAALPSASMSDQDVRDAERSSLSRESERPSLAPSPQEPIPEAPADLGFGSVIGGAQERRLLNRDGTFTSKRVGFPALSYLNGYHALLTVSWPRFLAMVATAYFALNALFAWGYLLCGVPGLGGQGESSMGGHWLRAFFFSVETFATIGYGHVYPVGGAANWVVTIESLVSLLAVALMTGIVFARFSRPTAAVMFSDVAVVGPYQGTTGFMFRITNARSNQLMELEAKVLFSRLDGKGRRYDQLKLERTKVVFFQLSWTIVHPITEASPLFGCTHQDLVDTDAEFLILLSGIDETFAQMVHARSSYKPPEIVYGAKFATIYNPVAADGTISIDVSRLSEIEHVLLDGASESDFSMHTQTFRHTGLFTGFAPPRSDRRGEDRRDPDSR